MPHIAIAVDALEPLDERCVCVATAMLDQAALGLYDRPMNDAQMRALNVLYRADRDATEQVSRLLMSHVVEHPKQKVFLSLLAASKCGFTAAALMLALSLPNSDEGEVALLAYLLIAVGRRTNAVVNVLALADAFAGGWPSEDDIYNNALILCSTHHAPAVTLTH